MKIIFLDIDGVLATPTSYKQHHRLENHAGERWQRFWFYGLEQSAIDNLNELADTGARIVVSSTWRHGTEEDFTDLITYLNKFCGIKMRVIDRTESHRKLSASRGSRYQRGNEIKEWVDNHPDVTDFVVFDDDSDMDAVEDHFVHIPDGWAFVKDGAWHSGVGIEKKHIEKARKILEGNL